jgi:hypothetical protein
MSHCESIHSAVRQRCKLGAVRGRYLATLDLEIDEPRHGELGGANHIWNSLNRVNLGYCDASRLSRTTALNNVPLAHNFTN